MSKAHFAMFARYNKWANDRLTVLGVVEPDPLDLLIMLREREVVS